MNISGLIDMISKIFILDGYTDEPAGLGVPPYINVYPRLVAGIVWLVDPNIYVYYSTIDQARGDMNAFIKTALSSDLIVFITGTEVPGKYIGGKPITLEELLRITALLRGKDKILIGPAARYGFGHGGGSLAVQRAKLKNYFTEIVYGDPEVYMYQLLKYGWEKAEPWRLREDYDLANKAFIHGAKIIEQHPNHGWNLIVEIETYRGCPRWISGGCSFCIEPRYGRPIMREPRDVVAEVEALYRFGARHIRIGRQPDILAYMSRKIGEEEYPEPNPEALRQLFYGIRNNAPGLRVIHIDNVNPGTIIHNREKAIEALKTIIKYHTPGDVAALGIETFDPRVVRANNLKVYPDEAVEVVRIINKYGSIRGWNGLPHLLPGINLLYGLPGETRETYRLNYEYLKRILEEGLIVRRINIRKVVVLENTPLWLKKRTVENLLRRHHRIYEKYRILIMKNIDRRMIEKITPRGTLLRYLYTEKKLRGRFTAARFPGSYPILVKLKGTHPIGRIVDARVESIAAKSVTGIIA